LVYGISPSREWVWMLLSHLGLGRILWFELFGGM
jgi:hypothetical protein